jgi:hypothetical protein
MPTKACQFKGMSQVSLPWLRESKAFSYADWPRESAQKSNLDRCYFGCCIFYGPRVDRLPPSRFRGNARSP